MNEASASLNRLKTSWIADDGVQATIINPTRIVNAIRSAVTNPVTLPTLHQALGDPVAHSSAFCTDTNGNGPQRSVLTQ